QQTNTIKAVLLDIALTKGIKTVQIWQVERRIIVLLDIALTKGLFYFRYLTAGIYSLFLLIPRISPRHNKLTNWSANDA
ncbi:MAG: hypothetical protein ACRDC6_00310, partial [Shewanella sp.]